MGGGGQKIKILALEAKSTKFCKHNLWASRELEMQKLGTGVESRGGGRGTVVGVGWNGA